MWRRAVASGLCAAAACRNGAGPSGACLGHAAAAAWAQPCCSHQGAAAGTRWLQRRPYAKAKDPEDEPEERVPGASNPRIAELVEEIVALTLLEISDLTEILSKRLNLPPPGSLGQYGYGPPGGAPGPGAAPAAAEAAPPPKTEFDIKLDGFDAAAKIKVIKEVRGMTSLGLKEAKELVEKAPTVIKAGVSKAEAEELKKKLEAAGGKVTLE